MTAVIPTHRRPAQLASAIESVKDQTRAVNEIVVVVDEPGRADETLEVIAEAADPRLVIVKSNGVGGAAARNLGIDRASSTIVALLDDDDVWLPHKLECQLQTTPDLATAFVLSTSAFIVRQPGVEDEVWPRRGIRRDEQAGDYLFCREKARAGNRALQTSSFVASKATFQKVPFDTQLPTRHDWDFVVRLTHAGGQISHTDEPLSVWNHDDNRARVSTGGRWRDALAWSESRREELGPRAFSGHALVDLAHEASSASGLKGAIAPLRAGLSGEPAWRDVARYPLYFVVPEAFRRSVRKLRSVEAPS